MVLRQTQYLTIALECPVCKQYHDTESDAEKALGIVLMQEKYSVCPNCLQSFEPENWTPEYKRRWTRYITKHYSRKV